MQTAGAVALNPAAPGLNMVERFFRDLTKTACASGVFRSVEELIPAIFAASTNLAHRSLALAPTSRHPATQIRSPRI